jgi:hypothetical protein
LAGTRKIIVEFEASDPAELDRLLAALREAGMHVDRVLEPLETVTGSLPPDAVSAVEAIPGVVAVQTQYEFQAAPPEDDVQ